MPNRTSGNSDRIDALGATSTENSQQKSVRLVAFDLDGTVLTSERKIHERSGKAIQRLAETGIHVVFASGRMAKSIQFFAEELGLAIPVVSCNGAYVLDAMGGEVSHQHVDQQVRDIVLDYADGLGLQLNIYCKSDVFFIRSTSWLELYERRVGNFRPTRVSAQEAARLRPTKMMIIDEPSEVARHHEEIARRLLTCEVTITISEPEYLEFLSQKANKGEGLAILCEKLNVKQDEVAAIGDYLNDIPMLQWARHSAAVSNAPPEVKSIVNSVFASNDLGGVADFIDSIVYNV